MNIRTLERPARILRRILFGWNVLSTAPCYLSTISFQTTEAERQETPAAAKPHPRLCRTLQIIVSARLLPLLIASALSEHS